MSSCSNTPSTQDQSPALLADVVILSPEQGATVEVRQTLPLVEVTFSVPLNILESNTSRFWTNNPPFVLGCRKAGVYQYPDEPPPAEDTYNLTRGVMTMEIQTAKVRVKDPGGNNVVMVWVRKANGRWAVSQERGFSTRVIP